MEIERAREDVIVAVAGALTTVLVAVSSSIGVVGPIGPLATLAPVFVYFVYLFSRKGGPYGSWDVARNWAALAALVGVVVLIAAMR